MKSIKNSVFIGIGLVLLGSACNDLDVVTKNVSDESFLALTSSDDLLVGFTLSTFWNAGEESNSSGHYFVSSKNNDGHLLQTSVDDYEFLPYQTLDNIDQYKSQKQVIASMFGSTKLVHIKKNSSIGLNEDFDLSLNFPSKLNVKPLTEINVSEKNIINWDALSSDEDVIVRLSYTSRNNGKKTFQNYVISGDKGDFEIPSTILKDCDKSKNMEINLGRWNEIRFESGKKGRVYAICYTRGVFKIVE